MTTAPVRVGIARLTHGHVFQLLNELKNPRSVIQIAGIAEPNADLAQNFARLAGIDPAIIFPSLDLLLETVQPEAVMAYGSIIEHLEVVQTCAPRGVHVMVEKPLAVSGEQAQAMAAAARQHGIHLLTNYETSWYASAYAARDRVFAQAQIGKVRRVVFHHGHWGPAELGVSGEFLNWLTDPVANGGGAIMDFGCYGPNLMTWLMDGAAPQTVTAVTATYKPQTYPRVDDDATILLTYPGASAVVQASWNWPTHRKDLEIYGETGYVLAPDRTTLRVRTGHGQPEETTTLAETTGPYVSAFAYLAAVVHGEIVPAPSDHSALENNLTVMRILDAARESARTGKTVRL